MGEFEDGDVCDYGMINFQVYKEAEGNLHKKAAAAAENPLEA